LFFGVDLKVMVDRNAAAAWPVRPSTQPRSLQELPETSGNGFHGGDWNSEIGDINSASWLDPSHRTHAAQALCVILDQTATLLPGSRLRIRFAMRQPRRIGLAFPGSPVERSTSADDARAP
jgi:hypothetical protein